MWNKLDGKYLEIKPEWIRGMLTDLKICNWVVSKVHNWKIYSHPSLALGHPLHTRKSFTGLIPHKPRTYLKWPEKRFKAEDGLISLEIEHRRHWWQVENNW